MQLGNMDRKLSYFLSQLGDWESITVTLNLNLSEKWDKSETRMINNSFKYGSD